MTEQQVVGHGERPEHQAPGRRQLLLRVAEQGRDVRLVDRAPVGHPVAQPVGDDRRVLPEAQGGVPLEPAPGILEGLRQVPVVERRHRRDARLEQAVDEAVVEGEPRLVDRAAARGLHPRPRHREPVAVDPQAGHQGEVLGPAVVVVAGDVTGAAVDDPAGLRGEGVPDAGAPAVLGHGPLDLVRRRARPEEEARRQPQVVAWSAAAAHRSTPVPASHPWTPSSVAGHRPAGQIIAHRAPARGSLR